MRNTGSTRHARLDCHHRQSPTRPGAPAGIRPGTGGRRPVFLANARHPALVGVAVRNVAGVAVLRTGGNRLTPPPSCRGTGDLGRHHPFKGRKPVAGGPENRPIGTGLLEPPVCLESSLGRLGLERSGRFRDLPVVGPGVSSPLPAEPVAVRGRTSGVCGGPHRTGRSPGPQASGTCRLSGTDARPVAPVRFPGPTRDRSPTAQDP